MLNNNLRPQYSDCVQTLLDCCGVSCESNSHLQALRGDVAHACFNVMWKPLGDRVKTEELPLLGPKIFEMLFGIHSTK